MEENYNINTNNNFNFKRFGLSVVLFAIEMVISIVLMLLFYENPIYEKQIFKSTTWLIGKIIPLIIGLVAVRKDLKDNFNYTKNTFNKFIGFCGIAFLIFYLFEMAASYYQSLMNILFNIGETTNQSAILEYFSNDPSILNYVLLFVTIVIVAPFIEELEFRKLIFDAFGNKVHFLIPSIVGAFLFGFVHLEFTALTLKEIAYFPVYFIPGLALSLIYHYSGRNIYASFIVHMLINLISFVLIIIGA